MTRPVRAVRLVRAVHGLRYAPPGELGPLEEPLLDARPHEGDLLLATVAAPASAWAALPEAGARPRTLITASPGPAAAGSPGGAAEGLARFAGRSAHRVWCEAAVPPRAG